MKKCQGYKTKFSRKISTNNFLKQIFRRFVLSKQSNTARFSHIRNRRYRTRKKKTILRNKFFWFAILFLFIFLFSFYFLIFFSVFQIKEIIISDGVRISKEDIRERVEEEITNKILFFETKSIFLVNNREIIKSVLGGFPAIVEIKISKNFPNSLNVSIVERSEAVVFCQLVSLGETLIVNDSTTTEANFDEIERSPDSIEDMAGEEECFLLDNQGIIFYSAESDQEKLEIRNLCLTEKIALGDRVVEKEKLDEILGIAFEIKQGLKIPIDLLEIASNDRLNVKTSQGWEVYFNLDEDTDWQVVELDLLLQKKISLEERGLLEYIDLRYSKVFYKYR